MRRISSPRPAPATPRAALIAGSAAGARDLSIWDDEALAEHWEAQPEPGDGKAA